MNDERQHIYHKCDDEDCQLCRGGLAYCVVCREGEAGLADVCPGPAPAMNDIDRLVKFMREEAANATDERESWFTETGDALERGYAEISDLKKSINTIQTIRMADEAEITRLKEKIAKFIYEENPDRQGQNIVRCPECGEQYCKGYCRDPVSGRRTQ